MNDRKEDYQSENATPGAKTSGGRCCFFLCYVCGEKFYLSTSLVGRSEKYKCPICQAVIDHEASKITPTKETPYADELGYNPTTLAWKDQQSAPVSTNISVDARQPEVEPKTRLEITVEEIRVDMKENARKMDRMDRNMEVMRVDIEDLRVNVDRKIEDLRSRVDVDQSMNYAVKAWQGISGGGSRFMAGGEQKVADSRALRGGMQQWKRKVST